MVAPGDRHLFTDADMRAIDAWRRHIDAGCGHNHAGIRLAAPRTGTTHQRQPTNEPTPAPTQVEGTQGGHNTKEDTTP